MSMKRMAEVDKDMIEGLKRIGFKYDIGEDETGHQMKYRRRGGGYNLDAGSSELMIKGEIGLLQYDMIERFCETGALMKDGTVMPADLIVLATGYEPQGEIVGRTLGARDGGKNRPGLGRSAKTARWPTCSSARRSRASGSSPAACRSAASTRATWRCRSRLSRRD